MNNTGKKKINVPVTWTMCGYVEIEAEDMASAMEKFNQDNDNIPIPEGEYVDDSFQLTSQDVDEMEAMTIPLK